MLTRPRMLDLFCGGGGAGMGYRLAGFDVVGVDLHPQPNYPFEFHQADALEYVADHYAKFDAIHASPPCQAFTPLRALPGVKESPDLIEPTRDRLKASGCPYIMENVVQAGLLSPVRLCGTMFGLKIYRHRNFETNWNPVQPGHSQHIQLCTRAGYLPAPERPFMSIHGRNGHNSRAWAAMAAEYMGTPWLAKDLNAVCEAIPPRYTGFLGRQLQSRFFPM